MTITILRPSSTVTGVGWTPSTGTLHGVTSDDNDGTYATWGGSGAAMILNTPLDAPPAGERRHQVRLRLRGEDGDAWWAVRLASDRLVAGASATLPASPATFTGSWGFGAPPDGSTVLAAYVAGQSTGVRVTELYLDVDSRLAPVFTAQVLDGSGASTITVGDTAMPTLHPSAINLDGLSARQYRYWVTLDGAIIWDTGVVSGSPADRQTIALSNGAYVAHMIIWSTLGTNLPYTSDEETLAFTISIGTVPAPDNPIVTQVPEMPFFEVEVCAPDADDFDGDQVWIEIRRADCAYGGYLDLPGA